MSLDEPKNQLTRILRELGVHLQSDRDSNGAAGFPLSIPLADGSALTLSLPLPGPLASMDRKSVGIAIVDALGAVSNSWGLASENAFLQVGRNVLQTPLFGLLDAASGGSANFYLDGVRYFSAPLQPVQTKRSGRRVKPEKVGDVLVLVIDAGEEQIAKRQASQSFRFANALKRVGRVLAMNQSVDQVCIAAAHEIAAATDLAAVALWTPSEDDRLKLTASVGITRTGQHTIQSISARYGASCVAELVGASKKPCFVTDVSDHIMTAGLEAQFCYLTPGSMCVLPLVVGDRVLGVLELIAKRGDSLFGEHRELFETFAEHLSLALNAAYMYETAEQRASRDALTGIANHRTMQEFLMRRLAEAKRNDHAIGVLMIDVDHFRAFNEEEGHDAGDAALQQVANSLKVCVRPYDLAARYGGEEFTVILPGSGPAATYEIASRILARIEAEPFFTSTGRARHLTVSIGSATYPESSGEPKTLLKAADSALFEAKRAGRNQLVMFEGFLEESQGAETARPIDVSAWIDADLQVLSAKLLVQSAEEVEMLTTRLPLSPMQASVLRALILLAPTFCRMNSHASQALLDEMESVSEFRVLIPSLAAINERFDGTGPLGLSGDRIPLLARVLHVILALCVGDGAALLEDSSRFDPEILGLMGDWRSAA